MGSCLSIARPGGRHVVDYLVISLTSIEPFTDAVPAAPKFSEAAAHCRDIEMVSLAPGL
jgi:hypothetical protein